MLRNSTSLSSFPVQPGRGNPGGLSRLIKSVDVAARGSLTTDQYIQNDKKAFTTLLMLITARALARGETINLDANEELLRLIPVLCAYFSHQELIELVGEKVTTRMLELQHLQVVQNLILEQELQNVLRAFNETHISHLLFKGPALAYTFYPEAGLRTYHDIDMLIRPDDLPRAHTVLLKMGYKFYEEYRSNVTDSKRAGFNYSLARSGSQFEVSIELHTAPHPSEIGTDFAVESLWLMAQPIKVLGESTLTLHPVDHLLYLCWHYRFHGFTRLLWLYDLVVMLRAIGQELDWLELVHAAHRQRLATTLYYCLSWCRDLFDVAIPAEVFVRIHPPWVCRLIVERIAMPDPVEMLALARWQSRRIMARRAMVDSTTGLIRAAIQALFPSPSSMGRRYMGKSALPLKFYFLYYFTHPWTTIAKGSRYLLIHREKKGHGQGSD